MPEFVACRGAGWVQKRAGTSDPALGDWTDLSAGTSFGDDPNDQRWIREDISDYDIKYFYPNSAVPDLGPSP